ncbi:MAG: VirB4 family type IV secretion/conjugal transfer ATPase [Steroidobacteraceae bacterium]
MTANHFLSHVGHWTDRLIIDRAGSLYAVLKVKGIAAELAGASAIIAAHTQDNALMRGLSDPRLEWWEHYCTLDRQPMPGLPTVSNWLGDRFDSAYREAQGSNTFFRHCLFITLVWHPGDGLKQAARALFGATTSDFPDAADADASMFESIIGRVLTGLGRRYDAERLGLRDAAFSECAEAWHLALNNRERPIGLTIDAIGPCIVPERITFGYKGGRVPAGVFEIAQEGGPAYGAILTFLRTPAQTRPTMLDELRGLLVPMTITNSARLKRRATAIKALTDQQNRMDAARDASVKQREELVTEAGKIEDGEHASVNHHFSVAVFAQDISVLDARVARVQGMLSDAGVTAVRETDALKSAFYAQLPGNARWSTRPAPMKASNMLALAAKHAPPQGSPVSRWGAPIIYLGTTAGTAYPFHWHCPATPQMPAGDLGNTIFLGRSGSGKTALMGGLALLTLRVPRSRVLVIDRDFGLSSMVRGAGYPYLTLRVNQPSGQAPLRRLQDRPSDLAFLRSFLLGLIVSDDRGTITDDESGWLAAGVEREMRKPPMQRSIANIGAVLGVRDRHGAAARLRRWCRGEELGWAFDGETDDMDTSARMLGVDTTAILANKLLAGPSMSYLFHLANELTTGEPLLLVVDEMWAADQVGSFRDQNNAWLKTGRKREIVLALATQSAHDVLHSTIAHSFRQQVPRRIYFGETGADPDDMMGGMGLTPAEFRAVTQTLPNMPYSFLVQQPGGSYIARFDLSNAPGMVSVISGRDSTYNLANDLIAKYGADPAAWVPEYEKQAPSIARREVAA